MPGSFACNGGLGNRHGDYRYGHPGNVYVLDEEDYH
jgi:hypothetical protein